MRNASGSLIDGYQQQFGSKVTLTPDMSGGMNAKPSAPPSNEQMIEFGQSDLLQKADYTAKASILPDKLTMIDEMDEKTKAQTHIQMMGGGPEGEGQASGPANMPKTSLLGYDSANISEDFSSGKRKIVEGKVYAPGNKECLISQQLAKLNNLKIGDKNNLLGLIEGASAEFTISGIYSDSTMEGQAKMPFKDPFMNRNNTKY
ncbi:hypothetical protein [Bifidobacterium aemilianum]|uniref:hypothetical protein n=1 Tax=Bifidobacterium aemilianum TaxID=2493120 RepID=UPI000FDE1A7C|nr:hypothetical protein [Bifidobacterium aemilianum]